MTDPAVRFGLRAKLALAFSALIVLLIAAFGTLSIRRFLAAGDAELHRAEIRLRSDLVEKGTALVRSAALSAESALAENNFEFLAALIDTSVRGDPDVAFAAIVDPEGRVVVHSDPAQRGRTWRTLYDQRVHAVDAAAAFEREHSRHGARIIDMAAPIGRGADRLGTLRFGLDTSRLEAVLADMRAVQDRELRRVLTIYLALTVAFVLVGVVAALFVSAKISRPLSRLAGQARTIASGTFDVAIPQLGHDEVGALASNFETMRRAIEREIGDVRALHDVAAALSGARDRATILRLGWDAIRQRVGARSGALYLAGVPLDRPWPLVASEGFSEDAPAAAEVRPGVEILRAVAPIAATGTEAASLPAELRPRADETVLCSPLLVGAARVGLLALSTSSRGYEPREVRFVETVCSAMAQSLENIRLLEATAEQARMEGELRTAQAVQRALIPEQPPAFVGLEVAGAYVPATEVGGDWYGFLEHHTARHLHVLVGDVTGHGVPSALLSASACTTCRVIGEQHRAPGMPALGPAELLDQLNRVVCDVGRSELWMTFFAARFDIDRGEVVFANAGHTFPYHVRAGNGRRRLAFLRTPPTPPLGSQGRDHHYAEHRAAIAPGDVLVFFTDGLVENKDPSGKPFGYPHVDQILADAGSVGAAELRDRILGAAYHHYRDERRADDITLVVVKATDAAPAAQS